MMKSYDSLGSEHSAPENCGTSQAVCTRMMKSYVSLRLSALSEHTTPEKLRGVSGFLHPDDEFADSLGLSALFAQSTPEN